MFDVSLAFAAFFSGILMFIAPCSLPLIPAFLAFISDGTHFKSESAIKRRFSVLRNACWFMIGFGATFTIFGVALAYLGTSIGAYRNLFTTLGGIIVILFGISLIGLGRLPVFTKNVTFTLPTWFKRGTPLASMLVGSSIAIGWSPCIGPILATVFIVAATKATVLAGAVLLCIFSLGFAVPFLLTAYFYERVTFSGNTLLIAERLVRYCGGLMLISIGYLLLTDSFSMLAGVGLTLFEKLGLGFILNYY